MSVTCYLSGRFGNICFHLAHMIAYAKKHNLKYWVPTEAMGYNHFRNGDITNPINIKSTGPEPVKPTIYDEPDSSNGTPCYHEIPKMDNVKFTGWWQSFKYFDWCRDYILETFNFPYKMNKGVVSVNVRRGDCVGSTNFPIAPPQYYHKAIEYMQERGYNKFLVHSDDQPWCKNEFTSERYHGATFEFFEGTEMENYLSIQNCEHNITARSTFSLTAAWFNRNPNKIVLVPTTRHKWWRSQNKDLIPDYFTQIDFDEVDDSGMEEFIYEYNGFDFTLVIKDYWNKIYAGKKREPLYHDYAKMLEFLKNASKDKYVLDIGANHGIFAVPASKLGYKVLGFEPVSTNIHSLVRAREINDLDNFEMFHLALSSENKEIEIFVPECHDNASLSKDAAISNMIGKDYKVEKVGAVRFDDWIKDHPNFKDIGFIKIDTQGAEYDILSGMRDFLMNITGVYLIVEFEGHLQTMGWTFQALDNLIFTYGFRYLSTTGNDKYYYKG